MICKQCGKTIPDNSVYCSQCGAPLNKAEWETGRKQEAANDPNRQEQEFIQSKLNAGRLYGIISIVCSILGLGSFGTLDVIAIICGYIGLKNLKYVPNDHPEKQTALVFNRAGIICSAGFIFVILAFVLIALVSFPWVFGAIASFFAGLVI